MTTLAESLISSTSRPLLLRMRPDLSSRRHRYHGQTFWVVKEPVGLQYFRFHEEEYAILCMLDGMSSLEEIKDEFESQFAPQKITYHDMLQFVGMLHRSGLVISEATGQGHQLRKRRDQKKRRELLGKLAAEIPAFADLITDDRLEPALAANLNGDRFVSDPQTPLDEHDCLLILSADAGG